MSANSGKKKKCRCFRGGDKIAGKPAIAGELTGLSTIKLLYDLISHTNISIKVVVLPVPAFITLK